MKKHLLFASLGFLAGCALLSAQESGDPSVLAPVGPAPAFETAEPASDPSEEQVPTKITIPDDVETRPLSDEGLLPDANEIPDAAFLEEEAKPKRSRAEELRETIRIRQLIAKFSNDPSIAQYKTLASKARTPEGRRTAMRNYYTALYERAAKAAPELEAKLELLLYRKLMTLEQTRVAPSVLIEPIRPLPRSRAKDHAPVVDVVEIQKEDPAPTRWSQPGPDDQRPPETEPAQLEAL